MAEIAYYARLEAGFEAFPAENYVDYMTNVMPIPERHFFYISQRGIAIVCEVRKTEYGRVLEWSLKKYASISSNIIELRLDIVKIDKILAYLDEFDSPRECGLCEEYLGSWLKFF